MSVKIFSNVIQSYSYQYTLFVRYLPFFHLRNYSNCAVRCKTTSFHNSFSSNRSTIWNKSMYNPLFMNSNFYCNDAEDDDNWCEEILSEESNLIPRSMRDASMPHQVFVIQPNIKWGPKKVKGTSPDLQLEEAVALVKSLSNWAVVDKKLISLLSFDKKQFFNKGQLIDLRDTVKKNSLVTSVFVNVKTLKVVQQIFLESVFKVPVFDRYSIIINIFKQHAITKEAKLQVSLAEIPYFWSRINDQSNYTPGGYGSRSMKPGETYLEKCRRILSEREKKIKNAISTLRKNRDLLRSKRQSMEFPVVAVVGYTNAGKTSLIKCLTEVDSLRPENKLFATLDVTVHSGLLTNNMRVLYVDTLGFIADIPTNLIEPFIATLEDAIQADAILHVRDISHPDTDAQNVHVLNTLKGFSIKQNALDNIIVVGNKCDKVKDLSKFKGNEIILTSCLNSIGLESVKLKIEEVLLNVMDISKQKIRVRNGGSEYAWLHKNSTVYDFEIDQKDQQYVILSVMISGSKLGKFKHEFIFSKQ